MSKQHKRPGQRDDARPDRNGGSFDDVLALVKEQRKYADWIRALEAKKEQTSPQAYARVRADYEARLDAVGEKLASHRDTLSNELAKLREKLAGLDAELQQHHDDRAEIELRAHVGELTAAALTDALRVADTEIDRLTIKRNAVEKDLWRVEDFFAAADGTETPPRDAQPKKQGSGFDEMSFLNSVVGPQESKPRISEPKMEAVASAPVAESPPPLRPVEVPPTPPVEVPAPSRPTPAPQPAPVEPPATPTPTPTPTPAPTPTPEPVAPPSPPEVPVAPPRVSVEKPIAAEASVQADGVVEKAVELERTSVPVSRPSIAMQMSAMTIEPDVPTRPTRDSMGIIKTGDELPPSILEDLRPGSGSDKPLAANVASNNPLSLKSAGSGDTKTLKCRECGSMNDPSEWYCERCGAELSAI
jgi:hypothetical protein